MSSPSSLAYRTDLFCLGDGTELARRDGYLVVRSPQHPLYFWGNLLLFDAAPTSADVTRWPALFEEEFSDLEEVTHRTFGWDDPTGTRGAAEEFLASGYELEHTRVLRADHLRAPPRGAEELDVRPLISDEDWRAAFENQMACRPEVHEEAGYARFKAARMRAYRQLSEAGRGHWYGGFLNGRLVGDLGIFHDGELGRFQAVGTHPDFRRRGVCGTLVHRAGVHALEGGGLRSLVLCAGVDEPPERIYRSVGLAPVEEQVGLCWWPQ